MTTATQKHTALDSPTQDLNVDYVPNVSRITSPYITDFCMIKHIMVL